MLTAVGLVVASILSALPTPVSALDRIMFPVIGPNKYYDDFYAYRSGTTHNATVIMAAKMQPIVSASDGVVVGVWYPQPSWGYSVSVRDDQGYRYNYIHMNNDTPGTDDGNGGAMNAYAADMKVGNRVVRGQLLGWVGDSGNAETTASHLHFEIDDRQVTPSIPTHISSLQSLSHGQFSIPNLPMSACPMAMTFMAMARLHQVTSTQIVILRQP